MQEKGRAIRLELGPSPQVENGFGGTQLDEYVTGFLIREVSAG